uniref:aldose epimerase family protein n=1 Tax=Brachyspira catarrhinii TaxID=2528966 RepID=UPI003F4C968E
MFRSKKEDFGKNSYIYTLENDKGLKVKLAEVGATITGIFFKDKEGKEVEVAFGSDDIEFYTDKAKNGHMGATVGRVAGRTLGAKFKIDDKEYNITANKAPDHTHGGTNGLSYVMYKSIQKKDNEVLFSYVSKDGEEGYPGNLNLIVKYTITDENEIIIDYIATTDKATPLNIMNHSYFNLNGGGNIKDHEMFIDAKYYLADENGITSGEILKTKNTPYDFTSLKKVDDIIKAKDGCDNCFIFDDNDINKQRVKILSRKTNIALEVFTTQPSVLFYTANHFNNFKVRDKILNRHEAFCLETQNLSCALNFNHFPNIILYPDREYNHRTIYKFSLI